MKRFVEGQDRGQLLLLPDCLDDYVGENNPVRVVDAFIDELDLAVLGFAGVVPEATGRPSYHPATLLKIYLYGYLNRVQSSRRLEREAQRNIELMWLTGRLAPDFKTIADFRKDNGAAIRAVCSQFVVLCRQLGLFTRAVVAIDGSKFKAVNNRDKNYTVAKVTGRMEQVDTSIARYLRALDRADREESDIAEAKSVRLKEKIAGLRRQMHALKVMEQTVQDAPDQQVSLTDPDARSMATSGKGTATVGYNVQIAVDAEHHLIVAHEVTNQGYDRHQLAPMAFKAQQATGCQQVTAVADRGYFSGDQVLSCEGTGVAPVVPKTLTSSGAKRGFFTRQDFIYNAEHDHYTCPAGAKLTKARRRADHTEDFEKREVFDRSWLYAGHVSEIAKPGDFITRRVGGRPLILVRDRTGEPHALLNSCPHRGNIVCRERAGSGAQNFVCFYHAWNFDLDGSLAGVPDEASYTPAFERSAMGLKPVPRFENYKGMLFVNYDRDAEDLVSYLGNAHEYLDYMLDFGGDDVEIVPGSQAYSMKANWKLLIENSIDGYHAVSTHYRYFVQYLNDMGADTTGWLGQRRQFGIGLALGGGHSVIENPQRRTPVMSAAEDELARIRARLVEKYGAGRAHRIADFNRNLFIFPNLILISNWHTVRTWYPLAPDYIEIDAWAALPRDDSPELRQKRYENFISFLGPAGFGTPDDVSGLEGCQRGFATCRELEWSDISRGMGKDQPSSQDELQMRAFWRRWNALMKGERGPTDCSDRPPAAQRAAAE